MPQENQGSAAALALQNPVYVRPVRVISTQPVLGMMRQFGHVGQFVKVRFNLEFAEPCCDLQLAPFLIPERRKVLRRRLYKFAERVDEPAFLAPEGIVQQLRRSRERVRFADHAFFQSQNISNVSRKRIT
jgi:hypothetical protein